MGKVSGHDKSSSVVFVRLSTKLVFQMGLVEKDHDIPSPSGTVHKWTTWWEGNKGDRCCTWTVGWRELLLQIDRILDAVVSKGRG